MAVAQSAAAFVDRTRSKSADIRITAGRLGRVRPVYAGVAIAALLATAVAWQALRAGGAPSGSLTVTSRPAGAVVLVDGQPSGTAPTTIHTAAGSHVLEIRSAGPTQIVSLQVADGGQVSRYFDLPAGTAAARLEVRTAPAGAIVTVDGRQRGTSPHVIADLNPGPHYIRAALDGQTLERVVMMESGANGAVTMSFGDPGAAPPAGHGFLAVTTPIEIRAFENGSPVGTTKSTPWQLSAGRHELELVNEILGVRERRSVDIADGHVHGLELPIAPGMLSVSASAGAEVLIDGQSLGAAPVVKHPVPAGQHDVIARDAVLGERRLLVTVLPGEAIDVAVELKRQ